MAHDQKTLEVAISRLVETRDHLAEKMFLGDLAYQRFISAQLEGIGRALKILKDMHSETDRHDLSTETR